MISAKRANAFVRAAAVSAVFCVAGCGDSAGEVKPDSGINPGVGDLDASLEFTAVIEGRITDGVTREPLQGITIELSSLGVDGTAPGEADAGAADAGATGDAGTKKALSTRSAVSDADGNYQLTVNTPGTHILVRRGMATNGKSYARVRTSIIVDPNNLLPESASGQYVIGVTSDQAMYPKNGKLKATVFGNNKRDVIADARVIIRYGGGIADPDLATETVTDSDGKFVLKDMPTGLSTNFQVRPVDRDDDGVLDTSNYSQDVVIYETATTEAFIGPVGALVAPRVLWHDIDSTRTFPVNPEFNIVYSHAMDTLPSSTEVTLEDLNGQLDIATEETWDTEGFELKVTPQTALQPGHNYRILIYAWSHEPSRLQVGWINFRTEGGADDEPVPGAPVLLSDPDSIPFATTSIRVGITPIQDVEQFRIYARTNNSSEWIWVHTHTPTGQLPYETVNVGFSAAELRDVATPQGSGSLFSHGGALQLAAAAVFANVPGPLSPALKVERTTCLNLNVQLGTNNTPNQYSDNRDGTQPKPLVIQLIAPDRTWLASDLSPALTFRNSSLVTDALSVDDFDEVRVNPWTIEWRSRLPLEADSQFAEYSVDVAGSVDVGGNDLCDPDLAFDRLVPTNGTVNDIRWHFEAGKQDWSDAGAWNRGIATNVGPINGGQDCNSLPDDCNSAVYFGTDLDGVRDDGVASVLTTPTFRTPVSNAQVRLYHWLALHNGGAGFDTLQYVFVNEDEDDEETVLVTFNGTNQQFWQTVTYNITSDVNGHLEFRFTSVDSVGAATEPGVFIDDVTITGQTQRTLQCNDIASCTN